MKPLSAEHLNASLLPRVLRVAGGLALVGLLAACSGDETQSDVPTLEAQGALDASPGLDFGGMWGYINGGVLSPNPATSAGSCPAGYTATKILDTINVDFPVFLCSRPHQADSEPRYDFGGMWGFVNGGLVNNPFTNANSCPAGYTDQQILGTNGVDWVMHVCYKTHTPGTVPAYPFGGMWGYVNGGLAPNPATGAGSCPGGFVEKQVLGTVNVDYPVFFCAAI